MAHKFFAENEGSIKIKRKAFYEIAAEQSGVGSSNIELPDSLLEPIVSTLDPCTIKNLIYSQIDWNLVKTRSKKKQLVTPTEIGQANSKRKNGKKRLQPRKQQNNAVPSTSNTSIKSRQKQEEEFSNRIHAQFTNEIIQLVDHIKRSKPENGDPPGWPDKEVARKAAHQLVVVMSYLPSLITVEEAVFACLSPNGIIVIEKLLTEMPDLVNAVVNRLLNHSFIGAVSKVRVDLLWKVIQLFPSFRKRVIYRLVKNKSDCNFACRLAVDTLCDTDFIDFLEPELVDKDSLVSENVIKSGGRHILPVIIERIIEMARRVLECTPENVIEIAKAPYCTRLTYCIIELLDESWKEQDIVTITKFIFRTTVTQFPSNIHSKVRSSASITDEKMDTGDFSMMTFDNSFTDSVVEDSQENQDDKQKTDRQRKKTETDVEPSPFGNAHESFVLAALVAVPIFTQYPPNQTSAVQPPDRCVEVWLDHARRRTFDWIETRGCFCSDLLYVHSCMMSGRMDQLFQFASGLLKQKHDFTRRITHSQVLQNAFFTRCLNEIEVAERSVNLPITSNFNQNTTGRSALHSLSALQSAGVFKTFRISIASFLERQLISVSLPMSDVLSDVCETFGNNTASAQTGGLSEKFVMDTFIGEIVDESMLPRRLYVLLYLVAYREQSYRINKSVAYKQLYEESIYTRLPVRYLMTIVETRYEDFEHIRCRLIAKCGNLYPYMLPTAKSLSIVKNCNMAEESSEKMNTNAIQQNSMKLKNGKVSLYMLESIHRSSLKNQISALPLVLESFMQSLNGNCSEAIEQMIVTLFDRYEQLCPRMLFESACTMWLRHDEELRVEDLYRIPALLFRVDSRILNSPPHFSCFIRAMNFFAVVVRTELRLKMQLTDTKQVPMNVHYKPVSDMEKKERDHLTLAYMDSQHSVLIHALIEVCDPIRMKDDPTDFALVEKRQNICKIACKYLHRAFIDYDNLMKVVLYQKFPIRQIRTLVDEIPSLFAANSLILEMLSLPDYQRRIFAVVLASEICRKYRVRESLETARIVCDVVHSLHKYGELPPSNKVWKHITPALILLATEFPSLTDSISRLLNRVLANVNNRLAVRFGMLSGDPKHEEYQLISIINSFLDRDKKPMLGIVSQNNF